MDNTSVTQIGINSIILIQILSGQKTIEGRLAKGKFLALKPGDIISIREDVYKNGAIVESRTDAASIKIISVERYGSFRAMLTEKGFKNIIPSATTLDEACQEYARYYASADEKEHGVLGISFQVLSL